VVIVIAAEEDRAEVIRAEEVDNVDEGTIEVRLRVHLHL
jgi:hypothetical protein